MAMNAARHNPDATTFCDPVGSARWLARLGALARLDGPLKLVSPLSVMTTALQTAINDDFGASAL
jgi:hypothetical protein